jgi:hypothetical protein
MQLHRCYGKRLRARSLLFCYQPPVFMTQVSFGWPWLQLRLFLRGFGRAKRSRFSDKKQPGTCLVFATRRSKKAAGAHCRSIFSYRKLRRAADPDGEVLAQSRASELATSKKKGPSDILMARWARLDELNPNLTVPHLAFHFRLA